MGKGSKRGGLREKEGRVEGGRDGAKKQLGWGKGARGGGEKPDGLK